MQNKLTHWKRLMAIAWPLIIANSFWNLQLTIDRIFLGNYSTEALGAAMAVMGVFWTPMALLQQTSAYITTFVAQYYGSKQNSKIGPALWQSIYVSLIGGVLFCGLIFLSEDVFKLMGHAESVMQLEIQYFNAILFSALPTALVASFSGLYTGLGKTRMVIAINAVGLIVNALFDYLLIFGNWGFPELGIQGAGYATALAGGASSLFAATLVFKSSFAREFNLLGGWKWNTDILKRFLRFGLPSGLQWALEGLAFTIFLLIIGRFPNGAAALSASSIAVTIMMLSILPCLGVAQSVMALVGQHLGDKKPELAARETASGIEISLIYMVIMSATFLLVPEFYINWFKNDSDLGLWQEVAGITKYLLMFVALFTLFDCLNLNFSFALKGAGDTQFVSIVALIIPWPTMVIPTILFSETVGAIYWAWGFASVYIFVLAIIFWLRFKGGKWKSMSVI